MLRINWIYLLSFILLVFRIRRNISTSRVISFTQQKVDYVYLLSTWHDQLLLRCIPKKERSFFKLISFARSSFVLNLGRLSIEFEAHDLQMIVVLEAASKARDL